MKSTDETTLSLADFPPADKQTWKAQILQDIRKATAEEKQAVYEDKMRWKTYEGITIEPFYTQEDIQDLTPINVGIPQQSWHNRQYIRVKDARTANTIATAAIHAGADALLLDLRESTHTELQLSQLLQHIKLSQTPVSFRVQHFPVEFLSQLQQVAPYQWKGSLFYDPLAELLCGKEVNPEAALDALAQAVHFTQNHPHFLALTVSSHHLHEAGASAVQELAFLLNTFVEYAHQLTERGVAAQDVFAKTELSISVSTSYFIEIAKIRALHLLWLQLAKAYRVETGGAYIHARTAQWNKPATDAYNNMIRVTIEAMAATLGGVSSITIWPYNNNPDDAFAARMASNVSVILKEESYFTKVLDVASGSYYIEHLTHSLAEEAWKLFQTTEARGGFVQATKDGFIQEQITRVGQAKEADVQSGKQVLVGVNKYAPQKVSEPEFTGFKKLQD